MIYRIYGEKDTTIYELNTRKNQNTGLDEVLEVTKFFDEETETVHIGNSRILTKFDLSEISASTVTGDIPLTANYQLNLTSTEANEVLTEYTLEVYPISQSWSEGSGQFFDNPITQVGSTWQYRDGSTLWGVTAAQIFNGVAAEQIPTSGVVL